MPRVHPTDAHMPIGSLPDYTAFYLSRGHDDSEELFVKTKTNSCKLSKFLGAEMTRIVDSEGTVFDAPSDFSADIPTHLGTNNIRPMRDH